MLVGALGTLINLGILYSLTEFLGFYYIFSATVGFVIAGISNFTLDKIWTFKETLKKKYFSEYFHFFLFSLITLGLNLATLYVLTEYLRQYYIFSQFLAILIAGSFNFWLNKIYTFRELIIAK